MTARWVSPFSFCGSLVFLLLCTGAPGRADDASDLLKRVEKRYRTVENLTVEFRQDIHYGVTGAEQSFRGTLYTKKGNKYRIEMEDQTIVTDGASVWSYAKGNNQVIIDRFKESPDALTPDRVFVDIPARYLPVILGAERVGGVETTIMKLTPKERKSTLQWMKVWVDEDEYLMRKIQVLDVSGNLTTYLLEKIATNQPMKENLFTFDPPDGVELIDLR